MYERNERRLVGLAGQQNCKMDVVKPEFSLANVGILISQILIGATEYYFALLILVMISSGVGMSGLVVIEAAPPRRSFHEPSMRFHHLDKLLPLYHACMFCLSLLLVLSAFTQGTLAVVVVPMTGESTRHLAWPCH